jgi:hypothetical protein
MVILSDGTSGGGLRSNLSVVLIVNPSEPATMEQPPQRPDWFALRPSLVLPCGVRVCVDLASSDVAAAKWWDGVAVHAAYASMWHTNRGQDGPQPKATP